MDNNQQATNWTAYYQRPFFLSRFTRWLGARHIRKILGDVGLKEGLSFLELGGGNSCVFGELDLSFQPSRYTVIDNNELGLSLLQDRVGQHENLRLVLGDLFAGDFSERPHDVVLSLGLIEHFDRADTYRMILRHFELVKPGGCVLITFPTPTRLYRASRWIAEAFGRWAFPDERPLEMREVIEVFEHQGSILHQEVGSWTPFTQGVILGRRAS